MANKPAQSARASKPRVPQQGGYKTAPKAQPRVTTSTRNAPTATTPQQAQPKRRGMHRSGQGGTGKGC